MEKQIWMLSLAGKLPCMFREITGLYCPGCGGTRAVKALLKARPLISFLYHPLVIYAALVTCMFAVSYLFYRKTKNPKYRLYLENSYVYVGLGIIGFNFLIKNFMLLVMGVDLLAILPAV